MNAQSLSITVSSSIGSVSALCVSPGKLSSVMTIAHGAGAGMNHPFMESLSQLLADEGIATLRFNFPFSENKKKQPDVPAVAHKTVEAAIQKAHELFPSQPLFASGKSFGGRMSSQYLSLHNDTPVKGIIFYGFPLHPPGKPSIDRAAHLKEVKVPMLFLQGSRDELATWSLIEEVCSFLPLSELVRIEGANHAFKYRKENLLPILANATAAWIRKQTGN